MNALRETWLELSGGESPGKPGRWTLLLAAAVVFLPSVIVATIWRNQAGLDRPLPAVLWMTRVPGGVAARSVDNWVDPRGGRTHNWGYERSGAVVTLFAGESPIDEALSWVLNYRARTKFPYVRSAQRMDRGGRTWSLYVRVGRWTWIDELSETRISPEERERVARVARRARGDEAQ